MKTDKGIRIVCCILLTGPLWAALIAWGLQNAASHDVVAAHLSGMQDYTAAIQKMLASLLVILAGIISFILGMVFLIRLKLKQRRAKI